MATRKMPLYGAAAIAVLLTGSAVTYASLAPDRFPDDDAAPIRRLQSLLERGEWQAASNLTWHILNPSKQWNGQSELPCDQLKAIDQLWVTQSDGLFGFGVQHELWRNLAGSRDRQTASSEGAARFKEYIGWTRPAPASFEETPLGYYPAEQTWNETLAFGCIDDKCSAPSTVVETQASSWDIILPQLATCKV